MKNYKALTVSGYIVVSIGIMMLILSYFAASMIIFFVGSVITLLGIISVVSLMTLKIFLKDKELEIEKLKAMGLTIVTCEKCGKQNVLEDQYCIYCGEELTDENIEI